MTNPARIKQAMKSFYASEARDRDSDAWIERGASARVPESRAAHYFIDRKVEEAIALSGLDSDRRVLEVGSSFGHMTFLLTQRFREVVAVDLSEESIELARRRAARYRVANVRFLAADAEDLSGFREGEFDGVFSFSTVRFCPHPDLALGEMRRVLKPGGPAVVDVPNRYCPWYGPLKRAMRIEAHVHDRLFTASEIAGLMSQAGFSEVRCKHILFTSKRVPDLALPLFKLMDRLLEPMPGIRAASGIIMAAGRRLADGSPIHS